MPSDLIPRLARGRLLDALQDSPVVLIHGPRQCGKTTLAKMVAEPKGYAYVTFDTAADRNAATSDPVGFVADLPDRVILDEVQHVPQLFSAIKLAVDRDRRPGRFILTGSANVLLIPTLSDSLAGRMDIIRLHPLAQVELERTQPKFLDRLLSDGFRPFRQAKRLGADLNARILAGGYPPAIVRRAGARRTAWYQGYVESIVERDIGPMSRIASLDTLPLLLKAAAAQNASLFNATALGAPFQISRPTSQDYVSLLRRVFLLDLLPPWHSNRLSRLVKTPKVHLGDTGLAAALLDIGADDLASDRSLVGPLLETFVFQELNRQASGREDHLRFHHFRDRDGVEVDLVIERGVQAVAGVEVKASATVTGRDFSGLRKLQAATPGRFTRGVVLYDGETVLPFGDRLQAVPIRFLWESP